MPYYGDGFTPYYYGGAFATHSSLMTGTPRVLHTSLSRFAPHLSTISESPLSNLRRYSPVTSVPTRPRRVIDTADIDVSTPRILTRDTNSPRSRLKRDRPTIKIRCQALKDNPALRQHHEKHEKTVGELLVEKFLIKDKKAEETDRRLKIYHQVSLDRDSPVQDLPIQTKITRRFTRRRSSADIQLDPEQLQREVAYAQVQAEVLDSLVAEEQAEIENEVRQGTLIRKGTVGGPRTVPPFYRSDPDRETMSQEEEEAAAQRMKKTLKKMKKKKKTTEKPSPPDGTDSNLETRRSSTASDVSTDLKKAESTVSESEPESPKPQMYKIEACNSVGDFSTVLVNSPHSEKRKPNFEQFRESVKLNMPKKSNELEETEVVLPVRKPYVKDTSRNSVYFTVKPTTPDSPKEITEHGPKESESISNGIDPGNRIGVLAEEEASPEIKEDPRKNEVKDALPKKAVIKAIKKADTAIAPKPLKTQKEAKGEPKTSEDASPKVVNDKGLGEKLPVVSSKLLRDDAKRSGLSIVTDSSAASVSTPSYTESVCLPKASKITPDENNAVEAPELSLSEAAASAKERRREEEKQTFPENTIDREPSTSVSDSGRNLAKVKNQLQAGKNLNKGTTSGTPLTTAGKPEGSGTILGEEKTVTVPKTRNEDAGKTVTKEGATCDEKKTSGGGEPKFSFKEASIALKGEVERTGNVEATKLTRNHTDISKTKERTPESPKPKEAKSPVTEEKSPEPKWKSKLPLRTEPKSPNTLEPPKQTKDLPVKKSEAAKKVGEPAKKASDPKSPLVNESQTSSAMSIGKSHEPVKAAKNNQDNSRITDTVEDLGSLSKSTSTESIDFWSQIGSPGSPQVSKSRVPFTFASSTLRENMEQQESGVSESIKEEEEKKKASDAKISEEGTPALSNNRVIEEKPESAAEEKTEEERVKSLDSSLQDSTDSKEPRKKKNLLIQIAQSKDPYATVKRSPLNREDSSASTTCFNSPVSTPDTSVPASGISTPIAEFPYPLINIVEVPKLVRSGSQNPEEEIGSATPTNEPADDDIPKISKWSNQNDLSNLRDPDKEVTPIASKNVSAESTPTDSPTASSKKKKVVKKKKASTTKKTSSKASSKKSVKKKEDSKKDTLKSTEPKILVKAAEKKSSPKSSSRNTPTQRPLDLIRMFYTTPSALLTATPRDLSKVKRAKIKRRKRTPSVSSDSTGSTTSTATTGSTGSTSTELDDDAEHKRMNSTRSNDSGFDGSPRISNCDMACHKKCEKLTGNLCGLNQKLVAEALQALKKAPSQSSENQRNSDSSEHFPSGRITPPATNLPRFKKYTVTDFTFLKVLGKGSFGKVLLAELRGTECVYAVKCLKKDIVLEDDDVECTLIERKVLTLATRHPYLCHLFCTFQTDSHLFFVMEYLNGGDLMFHIQKSGRFSETRARFYAAEIWSGLNFLHKKGIVYRDLKLDNVLLDFEGHIRIADFGMCKLQIFLDRTADTFCGTPDYMAPEIIKGLKYNQAVDWWSYGVLLYEMLTGQSPFSGCDEDELFWSICNERPFIPRYLSQESTDMLLCLLEKDSGKRLPGHEIAMHPFFQSLPWDRLERRQLEPPFRPALDHTLDTRYFDTAFTAERPRLTPVPDTILSSMDQGVFRGFSYTNPNATD